MFDDGCLWFDPTGARCGRLRFVERYVRSISEAPVEPKRSRFGQQATVGDMQKDENSPSRSSLRPLVTRDRDDTSAFLRLTHLSSV